jgi:uncharacterized protein
MQKLFLALSIIFIYSCSATKKQATSNPKAETSDANTLLWEVSGKDAIKPSYIYGTMHMLCKDDVKISENLQNALNSVDQIYFEIDMSDMGAMVSALPKMNMKGDTTLKKLLSPTDYSNLKKYMEQKSPLPFAILEKMQPLLVSSIFAKDYMNCNEEVSGVELRIIEINKKGANKKIFGLETIMDQINALGAMPYKLQAENLMQSINDSAISRKKFSELKDAYIQQDLNKLFKLMNESDDKVMDYEDALLTKRNKNWIVSFKSIFPKNNIIAAVGAAHLIGKNGIIQLLRDAGYTVKPVFN